MNGARPRAAGAVPYLSQFVRGGRDDPYPEANVNALRVIVQHERKLGEKQKKTIFNLCSSSVLFLKG